MSSEATGAVRTRFGRALATALLSVAALATPVLAETVERFPPPDFAPGYQYPTLIQGLPRAGWLALLDTALLVAALGLAVWLVHRRRNRRALAWLSAGSLLWFGFVRQGCVCPVGAVQNLTEAVFNPQYVVPLVVIAFFTLPLVAALFYGRVFCGGVCPLGALQDLVMIRSVRVPAWLEQPLRTVPYIYLGLAVLLTANGAGYVICKYDPFVAFFRMSARFPFWIWSGAMLGLALFVGRPYCRFLCPYGVLLAACSRLSWRRVRVAPERCINCHLCQNACAFGALNPAGAGAQGTPAGTAAGAPAGAPAAAATAATAGGRA